MTTIDSCARQDSTVLKKYALRYGLDPQEVVEAPPSHCRYWGKPVYWETLPSGRKRPVEAVDLQPHVCLRKRRSHEAL